MCKVKGRWERRNFVRGIRAAGPLRLRLLIQNVSLVTYDGVFKPTEPEFMKQKIAFFDRRRFWGAAYLPAWNAFGAEDSASTNKPNVFSEPDATLQAHDDYDGGGPVEIEAALTAARQGAKKLLIELQGSLGEIWTSGLLTFIFDFKNDGFRKLR